MKLKNMLAKDIEKFLKKKKLIKKKWKVVISEGGYDVEPADCEGLGGYYI